MNEMYRMEDYRDNYREDYRDNRDNRNNRDYRDYRDYRDDYRESYRDEYGRNQRDEYGRNQRDRYGRNRRSYRNYREEYVTMLEEVAEDGMELARAYEDVSEMASDNAEKQKLMKIAEREKEHYRMAKEMLQKHM